MYDFALRFLQLEVTAQCNLRCSHCYTESDSHSKSRNALTLADYKNIASSAFAMGARSIQVIGGEPAMWPGTPELLRFLRALGYPLIEYYSNFTLLPSQVAEALRETSASLAITIMSDKPELHDEITGQTGSWNSTTSNVRSMVGTNRVRASINVFPHTEANLPETTAFVRALGVHEIRIDRVRSVGRARSGEAAIALQRKRTISELSSQLCGACSEGSAYVAATGDVHFCGFSREVSLGNVRQAALPEILGSELFASSHKELAAAFERRNDTNVVCNPRARCNPEADYCPPGPCGPRRIDTEPRPQTANPL